MSKSEFKRERRNDDAYRSNFDRVFGSTEEERIAAGPPIFYEGAGAVWMWHCPACKESGEAPSPHLSAYDVPCGCNRR